MKRLLIALMILGGCNGDNGMGQDDGGAPDMAGPAQILAGAQIAALSADQKLLAVYTNAGALANGVQSGTLSVVPLPSGMPIHIDDGAFGATFNRTGQTLFYATNQVASQDMGSKEIFGAVHVWTPKLSLPVKLSAGVGLRYAAPPDGSFLLLWDGMAATQGGTGDVMLVKTSDCMVNACNKISVAAGVQVTAMAASEDGRYAAFVVKTKANGIANPSKGQTWLVDVAAGKAAQVSETTEYNNALVPISFSPDGALLAAVVDVPMGLIALPNQLQVVDTATGKPVAAWKQPMNTGTVELAFADPGTLLLHSITIQNFNIKDDGIYKVTTTGASRVAPAAYAMSVPQYPAGANKYLWLSTTNNNNGTFNVQLYDLTNPNPMPISIANAAPAFPVLSDDLKYAAFFEGADVNARSGTLTVAAIPAGTLSTVGAGINLLYGAGFASGSSKLLFVDKPDSTGAGALTEWVAGAPRVLEKGVHDFRARAADTVFYSITSPDPSEKPVPAAAIYQAPLP